jgi:hypothetical protein
MLLWSPDGVTCLDEYLEFWAPASYEPSGVRA